MFQRKEKDPARSQSASPPAVLPRFAGFTSRLLCVAADTGVAMAAGGSVHDYLVRSAGLVALERRETVLLVLLAYFAGSWASALKATPLQLVFGLRVVDEDGERLTPGRAVLRSALLVILIAGALGVVRMPAQPALGIAVLASLVLVGLAAVTRGRQAAHDVLARSVVVKAGTLYSPERREALRAFLREADPEIRRSGRPGLLSMVGNLALLALLIAVLHSVALEQFRRDRLYRVNYALRATGTLRDALRAFHREHGRLPADAVELGFPARTSYPDGGYYELIEAGAIRIRFTETAELMGGEIIMTPLAGSDRFLWQCHVDGDIAPAYLPPRCRETWRAVRGGENNQ
ncbi:MAG: hypothetical protein HKO62_07815 [Gammaproteobacteria bacterium]|nr:hypothetical protein [Gammaproteobacteria bacterium]